jgi:hypothetical protein
MPQRDRPGRVPAGGEAVNDGHPEGADGAMAPAGSGHSVSGILPGKE